MKEILEELQRKVSEFHQRAQTSQPGRWEALSIIKSYCDTLESILGLDGLIRGWLQSARAGETIQQTYQKLTEQIQTQKEDLQRLQQEYENLAAKEQEWQRLLEEQDRLQKELERLQRLQSLIEDLNVEELRQQVERLKEKRELLEAGELVAQISDNAKAIVLLAKDTLSKLDSETQEMLCKAEEMIKMVAGKAEELSQARERYERAQGEWEKLRAELEPLLEADRKVAEALPGNRVRNVLEAINEAEALIQAIEASLSEVIIANEQEHRKRHIFLGGS